MIHIRPYKSADNAALRLREVELQEFERTVEPALPPGEAWPMGRSSIFRCAKWRGRMLVAEDDRTVVVVCVYGRVPRGADENPEPGFVSDLVVMPAYRNCGIGQRLLAAAEAYARECGVAELRIGVLQRNGGALRLYQRLGFRPYRIELTKRLD
jgi:ribosomal protein S18 acetylase RimI-like enzyme